MSSTKRMALKALCMTAVSAALSAAGFAQTTTTASSTKATPGNDPKTQWSTKVVKINDKEAEVEFIAQIPKGWHIYSQNMSGDNGPMPTVITIDPNNQGAEAVGKATESPSKTVYEPAFETKVTYFENQAVFRQRIALKDGQPGEIKATVEYMMCNDGKCLPPEEQDLVIPVN